MALIFDSLKDLVFREGPKELLSEDGEGKDEGESDKAAWYWCGGAHK